MSCKQVFSAFLVVCCLAISGRAQQAPSVATTSNSVVPAVSKFSGTLTDANNKPLATVTGVTFSLYTEAEGGAPLWMETQNVQPDKWGHYSVTLGSTTSAGLPTNLFAVGEARWLGVQVQGQAEKPRVLLMSVPYAFKALDAETLGGKPASAFLQASKQQVNPNVAGVTGTGKANYIPRWLSSTKLGDSNIFENSAGAIGIGTTAPTSTLDVSGTGDFRNTLTLIPNGSAPALSVNGTAFGVSNAGVVSFVSGQTFPGTGTITGVAAGTDLTGGGTSGNVQLNLDTTKVPQLSTANTFAATQTIDANLALPNTTGSGVGVVTIGPTSFLHNYGVSGSYNTFVGGAGNFTTTGINLAGVGQKALTADSSGQGSTAVGSSALLNTTSGSFNTGLGLFAGQTLDKSNMTAGNNTFLGSGAAVSTGTITNATALGSNAVVGESNALVLGCISGQNNCGGSVNVGIGTTTPAYGLDVHGTGNFTGAVTFSSGQTFPGTIAGVTAGTDLTGGGTSGNVTLNVDTTKVPQLATANTFTGNQTVNGSVTATSFSGSGSGLTSVNAADLGGLAPSAFAELGAANSIFSGYLETTTSLIPDANDTNNGTLQPGLVFGATYSGEGISSNRKSGNQHGLDFYTNSNVRMSVTNSGSVGIGTTSPGSTLEVETSNSGNLGPTVTVTNNAIGSGTSGSLDFNTYTPTYGSGYNPTARVEASDDGSFSSNLTFYANTQGKQNNGLTPTMFLSSTGFLGVNTTSAPARITASGSDGSQNGLGAAVQLTNSASGGGTWYLRAGATGSSTPAGGFSIANTGAYFLTIAPNGYLGIGNDETNPTHQIQVSDGAYETNGTWTNASDRNLKDNFAPVDGASVLSKLNAIPMTTWNYKTNHESRHLGPMAQDFYGAFHLGSDDKHISTVDEGGVALAAVQALYREGLQKNAKIRSQEAQIQQLTQQVAELKQGELKIAALEARLTKLEANHATVSSTRLKRHPKHGKPTVSSVTLQASATLPANELNRQR
jgi:trimeric autotransporter adhesin